MVKYVAMGVKSHDIWSMCALVNRSDVRLFAETTDTSVLVTSYDKATSLKSVGALVQLYVELSKCEFCARRMGLLYDPETGIYAIFQNEVYLLEQADNFLRFTPVVGMDALFSRIIMSNSGERIELPALNDPMPTGIDIDNEPPVDWIDSRYKWLLSEFSKTAEFSKIIEMTGDNEIGGISFIQGCHFPASMTILTGFVIPCGSKTPVMCADPICMSAEGAALLMQMIETRSVCASPFSVINETASLYYDRSDNTLTIGALGAGSFEEIRRFSTISIAKVTDKGVTEELVVGRIEKLLIEFSKKPVFKKIVKVTGSELAGGVSLKLSSLTKSKQLTTKAFVVLNPTGKRVITDELIVFTEEDVDCLKKIVVEWSGLRLFNALDQSAVVYYDRLNQVVVINEALAFSVGDRTGAIMASVLDVVHPLPNDTIVMDLPNATIEADLKEGTISVQGKPDDRKPLSESIQFIKEEVPMESSMVDLRWLFDITSGRVIPLTTYFPRNAVSAALVLWILKTIKEKTVTFTASYSAGNIHLSSDADGIDITEVAYASLRQDLEKCARFYLEGLPKALSYSIKIVASISGGELMFAPYLRLS